MKLIMTGLVIAIWMFAHRGYMMATEIGTKRLANAQMLNDEMGYQTYRVLNDWAPVAGLLIHLAAVLLFISVWLPKKETKTAEEPVKN